MVVDHLDKKRKKERNKETKIKKRKKKKKKKKRRNSVKKMLSVNFHKLGGGAAQACGPCAAQAQPTGLGHPWAQSSWAGPPQGGWIEPVQPKRAEPNPVQQPKPKF
ncbi:hypothetical protein Scep_005284 [Stephania cephalantha]|uniref:Uncharacterized protein n=1 Tax=Stephania cephalantha TaxID=152367 RepID=A0AAP0PXC6_9MAGN